MMTSVTPQTGQVAQLRLVSSSAEQAEELTDRTPRALLEPAGPWLAAYAQAAVDVRDGRRHVGQLQRRTHVDLYARMVATWTSQPTLTSAPASRISAVRMTSPQDGVVEATVLVRTGQRTTAVAIRAEGWRGQWRATALLFV
jgi:hypothetical protein